MRLLGKDLQAGVLRLQVDSLDDLWTLRNLIQEGDLVVADTWRTVEAASDKIRTEKQEKRRMRLGVRVESVAWHDFDDHLRVLGTIEEGPQDLGRHHTHVLRDETTRLEIRKPGPLHHWQLEQVKEAVAHTKAPQVILLAIDDTEAQFAILRSYGVQMLGSLPAGGLGKRFDGAGRAKAAFFDEVIRSLRGLRRDPVPLLVVGPGWWREEFLAHARGKEPDLVQGARTDGVSQGGRNGIQEALRRDLVAQVARDHRVREETAIVEEVLARIAKDGLVAYGAGEVRAAVDVGAAERLLVTDELVRGGAVDSVLKAADATRCPIQVLATSHEAGAQLAQFAGIAALLRFRP